MKKSLFFLFSLVLLIACDDQEGGNSNGTGTGVDITDLAGDNTPQDSLSEYLAANPNDVSALLERAERYLSANNVLYAKADVTAAMELEPGNPEVLLKWGDVHFFANETRTARDAWVKCIEVDPDNVDCRLKLAELYSVVQNYKESLKQVNKVIEIDPDEPVAYFIKGNNIRDMNGDTTLSLRYVQQAIELDPDYWSALDYAAVMNAAMGNPVAESYYKRMLDINPESQPTYYKLGMHYMEQEQYNEALNAFTKATQLNPNDAESYFNMGYIHIELGVYDIALEYFNKSLEARELNHRAYYGRGFVYERMGDVMRAAENYREALSNNPQHEPSRIALQRVQQLMEQE